MSAIFSRPMLLSTVAALGFIGLFTAPAIAQDKPEVTVTPDAPALADVKPSGTYVSGRIATLRSELSSLKSATETQENRLAGIRRDSEAKATDYYATVALINARLQRGTTPGNPQLVDLSQTAQARLEELAGGVTGLNTLSSQIVNTASRAAYLLESVRATYGVSGALESDHHALRKLEDETNQLVIQLNRQLNDVSSDIDRRAGTLASERRNMQTLALAVSNGQLYGHSISNRAFLTSAAPSGFAQSGYAGLSQSGQQYLPQDPQARMAMLANTAPLVMIRFDRPNVDYAQALYLAASEALQRFPNANFELVAVSPASGNPAQAALASSDARANAESALRSLAEMGVPADRIRLSAAQSAKATASEVHLFLR